MISYQRATKISHIYSLPSQINEGIKDLSSSISLEYHESISYSPTEENEMLYPHICGLTIPKWRKILMVQYCHKYPTCRPGFLGEPTYLRIAGLIRTKRPRDFWELCYFNILCASLCTLPLIFYILRYFYFNNIIVAIRKYMPISFIQ